MAQRVLKHWEPLAQQHSVVPEHLRLLQHCCVNLRSRKTVVFCEARLNKNSSLPLSECLVAALICVVESVKFVLIAAS